MKLWRILGVALVVSLCGCAGGAGGGTADLPWSDSFDAPGDWLVESDATARVTIEGGALRVFVAVPNQLAWAMAGKNLRDMHLTVTATQVSGPDDNEYGVLVRIQDPTNFYRFSISGDGYFMVTRFVDGVPEPIGAHWTPSDAIQQGQASNVIEVIARGAAFTFIVNGHQLAQVEDATFRQGDVGLYVGTFYEPGVEIHFDNLHVEQP